MNFMQLKPILLSVWKGETAIFSAIVPGFLQSLHENVETRL
jgi:hypothetical protein